MHQGERTDLASIEARLEPLISQPEAASLLNVSRSAVQRATKVTEETVLDVTDAVEAGHLTVTAALPFTVLPQGDQAAALATARHEADGHKPTARFSAPCTGVHAAV